MIHLSKFQLCGLAFSAQLSLGTAHAADVLTQHYNNARTGANLNEWQLNPSNVNTNQFGLLYTRPLDDQIYAQPLVVTNVSVPSVGPRTLVIVCRLWKSAAVKIRSSTGAPVVAPPDPPRVTAACDAA